MSPATADLPIEISALPGIDALIPWSVVELPHQPLGTGWWGFNPSVHFDPTDGTWRCAIRCASYSLPGGQLQLSPDASPGRVRTRNLLATLDPSTLAPTKMCEIREADSNPRNPKCANLGLEDLRLFRTERDGLVGIATALQYNLADASRPEMVLCRIREFASGAAIDQATPLRGPWSFRAQKNWVPFDGAKTPRMLYSIERGAIVTDEGLIPGSAPPVQIAPPEPTTPRGLHRAESAKRLGHRAIEVKLRGPTAMRVDCQPRTAKVTAATKQRSTIARSDELRGGSQLVRIGPDRWLGIGHEMRVSARTGKLYWHTFYTVDDEGKLTARSRPLKLSRAHGIEFCAGMAIDPSGRVAISFGVDDFRAKIGVTRLEKVLDLLAPFGDARAETEDDGRDDREGREDRDPADVRSRSSTRIASATPEQATPPDSIDPPPAEISRAQAPSAPITVDLSAISLLSADKISRGVLP